MPAISRPLLSALPLAAALLALSACGSEKPAQAPAQEEQLVAQPSEGAAPGAQSTEYGAEPAGAPGVKVTEPSTPMTNTPDSAAKPAAQ